MPRLEPGAGRAAILSAFVLLSTLAAAPAHAICNLIPPANTSFVSELGSVSQRVAAPDTKVLIGLGPCDPANVHFSEVASENVVTLEFEPPTGATTIVSVPVANVEPQQCAMGGVCGALEVTIPSTIGLAGAYGLTGPARLRVVTNGQPSATIFALAVPGRNCARGSEGVFQTFTILPPPNDFGDLADGTTTEILATLDGTGSLLIPFDYLSVLPNGIGSPIARLVKGSALIDAFPGTPGFQAISIPSSSHVRSFTLDGRPLPPLLRVDQTGRGLFGTADGDLGIIRVSRTDPAGAAGEIFDLQSRMVAGKGPIVIDVSGESVTAEADLTVPLRGLRPSDDVVAFARDEAREGPGATGLDLNGDGDKKDRVAQVLDPRTGAVLDVAVATSEVRSGGLGVPAIEASGDLVAFLESEAAQNVDFGPDGDRLDARLRVFRATGAGAPVDLSPPLQLADGEAVIDKRSLAISAGNVFFREAVSSASALATEAVSVNTAEAEATLGGGAVDSGAENLLFGISISSDGRFVAFESNADNLHSPDPGVFSNVYVRDRMSPGTTELVSVDSSEVPCTNGRSLLPAISGDGQRVAFSTVCTSLAPGNEAGDLILRDRALGETWRLTQVGSDQLTSLGHWYPAISADGRFVAFSSDRDDLVAGDGNGFRDVFVVDVDACRAGACVPERVSVDSTGLGGAHASDHPSISADGRFVVFDSVAALDPLACTPAPCGLAGPHIFVRDRQAGTTRMVTVDTRGRPASGDSYQPSISADGRFVAFESRACGLSLAPCNGSLIYEIYLRDLLLGVTERVSLDLNGDAPNERSEFASVSGDGRFVTFRSLATDLVPEGGAPGRMHVYVRDRFTGSTERVDVDAADPFGVEADAAAIAARISTDGQTVAFTSRATNLVSVAETAGPDYDVFIRGPAVGTTVDRVLKVLRPATSDVVPVGGIPAAAAAVAGGRALILPPVAIGGPVRLYDSTSNSTEVLDATGIRVALSEPVLAFVTPANPFSLLRVRNVVSGGATIATGLAAGEVSIAGRDVVFASPRDVDPALDGDGDGNPANDLDRSILQILRVDPSGQKLTDVGQAVTDFEIDPDPVNGHLIAFRTREADPGVGDLNGDGDSGDQVMQLFDLRTGALIVTQQAAIRCDLPGCEPGRIYKVKGDVVSFLTRECDQGGPLVSSACPGGGTDLNRNGSPDDVVVQVFNTATGKSQVFNFSSNDGKPPTPLPDTTIAGTVLYQTVRECDLGGPLVSAACPGGGTDLDGNGSPDDVVTLLVGDQDDDGVFDQDGCISSTPLTCSGVTVEDSCVESPNADQLDSDLDAIGDVCDASPYCATHAPLAPPSAPPSAAACQRKIASAAQQYLRKRVAAQRICYKKLASGKLSGDARALCRGAFVGALEILPTDAKTADSLLKAAAKLSSGVSRSCTPEAARLALLDTCAAGLSSPTVASLATCVRRGHGEAANVVAELAYGTLGQIADPKDRRCQQAIGDGGAGYLSAVLRGASSCLDRWNKGQLSGDATVLCLGARDETAGLFEPSDEKTRSGLAKALEKLSARVSRSCTTSTSLLAARSACGTDAAGVMGCIECSQWRRAMELIRETYGPS